MFPPPLCFLDFKVQAAPEPEPEPEPAAMALATPSDMKKRYDVRRLGQLVADDGQKVSASDLDTDPVLLLMIDDASGMVRSHLLRGGRYTDADLDSLTGPDRQFLRRLTCDLAYGLLVQRRGYTGAEMASLAPGFTSAMTWLGKLAEGEAVFGEVQRAVNAGKPVRAVLSRNRKLVSATTRLFGDLSLRPGNPGDPIDFSE